MNVKDNGYGITLEDTKKLFKPYSRMNPKGVGSGLSLAKNIIDEMNGEIWVDNTN